MTNVAKVKLYSFIFGPIVMKFNVTYICRSQVKDFKSIFWDLDMITNVLLNANNHAMAKDILITVCFLYLTYLILRFN